ncbi:MAG: MFS transporter, partial [Acidimicrobiales bacterium]
GAFVAMAGWSSNAMSASWHVAGLHLPFAAADAELALAGLGFGLAIAPVNASILGSVSERLHGLASSLAVVARTVGMLAGISALTAIALHRFYRAQARIGSPLTLCPKHPGSCPAYTNATNHALLQELHTIFTGAGVCAGAAALMAVVLLRPGTGAVSPAPRAPSPS